MSPGSASATNLHAGHPGNQRQRVDSDNRAKPVLCPKGHNMHTRIVKELISRFSVMSTHMPCARCGSKISKKDASYECKSCKISYCMPCVSILQQPPIVHAGAAGHDILRGAFFGMRDPDRPVARLSAGDIFLCGPDHWGVHHVILLRSELRPEPEIAEMVRESLGPGDQIYGCDTIESTQSRQGKTSNYFPTRSFFQRNGNGDTFLLGDCQPGSSKVELCYEPVPAKVLLHPLRQGFDGRVFHQVVEEAAAGARKYGWGTIVSAFRGERERLKKSDYPDGRSREGLLQEIHKTWDKKPICASVAIKVWQMYFLRCEEAQVARGAPANIDRAVVRILEYMPMFCDSTLPAAMVKFLTQSSWVFKPNFD